MTNGGATRAPFSLKRWGRSDPARQGPGSVGFDSLADLESWMASWIADKLKIDRSLVDHSSNFTDIGLDSLAAIEFSGALEARIGRPISPSIAWEYATIEALAAHIYSAPASAASDMDL